MQQTRHRLRFSRLAGLVLRILLGLVAALALWDFLALPAHATEVPTTSQVFKYGNFTVTVAEDGSQNIAGGIFEPPAVPPRPMLAKHTIYVDFTQKTLMYYRLTKDGIKPVLGYATVTPEASSLFSEEVIGRVVEIDTNPTWCPTSNTRKRFPDLPPGCLPPGHEYNSMGIAKFIINWLVPPSRKRMWNVIRLHGASGYPPGGFWDTGTAGCVRLHDELLQRLIVKLGPAAVKEGIAVVFMRGEPSP